MTKLMRTVLILALFCSVCYTYDLTQALKFHEGFRSNPYRDGHGWSVGYGKFTLFKPESVTETEALINLEAEILVCRIDVLELVGLDHPAHVHNALTEMRYQLGLGGLKKFVLTLQYVRINQYDLAAKESLKSKWAKQTPARAKAVADRLARKT